jgi:DNA-binding GntR family transcriptional regulator
MSSSQADRLRAKIECDIISFNLKPGQRLDESKLAEKYGTSRTPVREALRQLSANGLIEIRPRKGAIVAKLGIRELVELLEVMAELEGACGRLAAKVCLKSDLDAIHEAHDACRRLMEASDTEGYKKANEKFHESIYSASRNSCLLKLAISVRNRVAAYRRLQLDQSARLPISYDEHDQIVRAIELGQPGEADRLLQEHVLTLGAEIRRLISAVADDG